MSYSTSGRRSLICVLLFAWAANFATNGHSQMPPVDSQPLSLQQILAIAESQDNFAAVAQIERQGEPLEVAKLYYQAMRSLYYQQRDLPRMIFVSQAGIRYCLAQADQVQVSATVDPAQREAAQATAEKLRGFAKALAYDLGANAWPGWQEPGIEITRSDLLAGLDAARLNLRLARELSRDHDALGNARWLLGAQLLANAKANAAIVEFHQAATEFKSASKPDYEQMAHGYAAIAKRSASPNDADVAREELQQAISALKKSGTEDAKFFAEQLHSVAEYFAK
ncbi:MAG: hypothetical protein KDA55_03135 [Planctomycetales bacterium]|nr:hypothetical protein [Planctomycetales bacterium]